MGRDRREYHAFDKNNVAVDLQSFDNTPRQRPAHAQEKKGTFRDDRMTFTEEQMKKETERCLGCGAVQAVSYTHLSFMDSATFDSLNWSKGIPESLRSEKMSG